MTFPLLALTLPHESMLKQSHQCQHPGSFASFCQTNSPFPISYRAFCPDLSLPASHFPTDFCPPPSIMRAFFLFALLFFTVLMACCLAARPPPVSTESELVSFSSFDVEPLSDSDFSTQQCSICRCGLGAVGPTAQPAFCAACCTPTYCALHPENTAVCGGIPSPVGGVLDPLYCLNHPLAPQVRTYTYIQIDHTHK